MKRGYENPKKTQSRRSEIKLVDLRSDTVTRPDPAMRDAMARAEVGDDVLGDDPTVQALEAKAAEILHKEAALFVPSGTMGNQLAIMTHTRRGDEVICGKPCHIQEHEVGAAAVLSAVTLVTIDAPTGVLYPEKIASAVREEDIHHPRTSLLCLECAHGSGAVQPLETLEAASTTARDLGLKVHLDGARIFNAALALGVKPSSIAAVADSVMFCVSKGLGAPVGSLLCGSRDFVERARKNRKLLGGGMRQAGILAAAGLHGLENNIDALADDHEKAKVLARALASAPGLRVLEDMLDINMVWFELDSSEDPLELVRGLEAEGILVLPPMAGRWRLVVHRDVDRADLDRAIEVLVRVLSSASAR